MPIIRGRRQAFYIMEWVVRNRQKVRMNKKDFSALLTALAKKSHSAAPEANNGKSNAFALLAGTSSRLQIP